MTEYDYSPAAYERYVAQQARVSNWVNDTLQQSHAYSNPFVLSPTLRDRTFYDQPDNSDDWSNGSSRPARSRTRSYDTYYDRTPPRYRTQSQSQSRGYPQQTYYAQPAQPSRTHFYAPPQNHQSPTRQAYVTQPPPGQIYHIPANAPPKASHTRHPSSKNPPQPYLLVQGGGPKAEYKRGPPIHAPVPTRPHAQQQPLLKRLLGFVTMSPVGGRSANRTYRY